MVIFLMLAANFQSFKVSFVVLSTVPAVLLGALLLLMITGSTLNLQSYMGIIMSVGVSIANAVLLITNAEHIRKSSGNAFEAAKEAAFLRMRPILMTSIAMIAGMIPMATGHGEGGGQVAPLARAVIGGLFASTIAALFILPLVFAWVQEKTSGKIKSAAMVDANKPPITARASGATWPPPSPCPVAMGIIPAIMAMLVIRMGRMRKKAASFAASKALPLDLRMCSALVINSTALAIETPTDMMMPMYDCKFNVDPVIIKSNNAPSKTAGTVDNTTNETLND